MNSIKNNNKPIIHEHETASPKKKAAPGISAVINIEALKNDEAYISHLAAIISKSPDSVITIVECKHNQTKVHKTKNEFNFKPSAYFGKYILPYIITMKT